MSGQDSTHSVPYKMLEYFNSLLSSISPLLTVDKSNRIRYANETFEQEFSEKRDSILGRPVTEVLQLNEKDSKDLIQNLKMASTRKIQNCEFQIGSSLYGYTVFSVEKDKGIILKNISEIRRLQEKVEELHSELLAFQEKERQSLARELHDGVGQTILAAKLNFISYKKRKQESLYQEGISLIDQASQELREIYTGLYPSALKEIGLEAATKDLCRKVLQPNSIESEINFQVKGKLPEFVETNIYRIIQEAITNVAKHSGATKMKILTVANPDSLQVIISDNGHGFEENGKDGFGLQNIEHRIRDLRGQIQFNSSPNQGTELMIEIPL